MLNAAENLEKTDKERLLPIINTYEKYQKILIQNDFLDNASACGFLLENIDKIENYKTSEPVFVSKFNELGEKQIELLEKLYEKVLPAKPPEITAQNREAFVYEDILGEIEGIGEKSERFAQTAQN